MSVFYEKLQHRQNLFFYEHLKHRQNLFFTSTYNIVKICFLRALTTSSKSQVRIITLVPLSFDSVIDLMLYPVKSVCPIGAANKSVETNQVQRLVLSILICLFFDSDNLLFST